MTAADPLGRFASTAQEDYPRAADNRATARWVAEWMQALPSERVTMLRDTTESDVVQQAARRELARRGEER